MREAVEYSPDPEEDLILLGVMEGEEPVVLLLGFFPAQERMAALALTGEDALSGTPDALQRELEERYSLTIDAWLSGEPESWQQLVQGLGAATLTLDQDSAVTLDGETVILRAGRQRLDSRLSMALFQSGSNHAGELAAAWCGVFCQSAEELGSEELFTRLNGGFETDLSYAEIARHIQGLGWLGEAKVPAQAAIRTIRRESPPCLPVPRGRISRIYLFLIKPGGKSWVKMVQDSPVFFGLPLDKTK